MNRHRFALIILLASSIVAAFAFAGGLLLAAPADALIVPGQSIGPVRLGVPSKDLSQIGWGQPDKTDNAGSISYLSYGRQRVTVAVRNLQVVLILTSSERYRTDKGLSVGQSASAVTAAYGPASGGEDRVRWYDAVGLVVVTGGGTVIRIGVFDPKTFYRAILTEERPARDVFLTARAPKIGVAAKDRTGTLVRPFQITVTVKNASPGTKALNPSFLMLADRSGKTYRFDPSTFKQSDACRSTVSVRPGDSASCTIVFMLPPGQSPRSIVYNDGGSLDEFFF